MSRPAWPLDLVDAPVLLLDRAGRIERLNRAAGELFGEASAVGTSFFALLPRGDPGVHAAADRWSKGDHPVELECDVGAPGGARRVAWTLATDGQRAVATGRDVTRWHDALEAARSERERLRLVVNSIPDPVFLKDEAGRWTEVNPPALEVFGMVDPDWRGHTDLELAEAHPRYHDALRYCAESDARAWEQGALSRAEELIPDRSGGARIYDTYKLPIFNQDGTRRALVVHARDITERVRAVQAVRRNEAQLRTVLETAPDLIGLVGADDRVEMVNLGAEALLGIPRDRIVGHGFADLPIAIRRPDGRTVPPDQLPVARARSEGRVRAAELAIERPDGRRVVLAVNAAPVPDRPGAVVFAATDVTRRSEIERVKSEFLKIASHELRTPLTPLRLLLDMSQRTLASGGKVAPATLARMAHQVDRLRRLIDELLDVARLERRHFAGIPRSEVDLAALAADIVEDFRLHARHAIALEVPSAGARVWANRGALERVLSNLVDNALKYGGGDIEVTLERADGRVVVSVRDHGPGIAPEDRAHLFERFYRVGSEATSRRAGLGLGLFVSRELLRGLGADLTFESEVGVGTTFSFAVPLYDPDAERKGDAPAQGKISRSL